MDVLSRSSRGGMRRVDREGKWKRCCDIVRDMCVMGKRDPTTVFVGIEEWLGNILAIGNRGDDEFELGQGSDAGSLDACKA